MNEPDLENELRALRPVAPTADLQTRIAADLAARQIAVVAPRTVSVPTAGVLARPSAPGLSGHWLRGLGWSVAGAAAALALVLSFQKADRRALPRPAEIAAVDTESENFVPAESERELVATDDSGILYAEGEEPVRAVRFHSVERYAWSNPETGARVEVEVPREDVVLMPVAMQ